MKIVSDNKPAIIFLAIFLSVYIGLNTAYGFMIEYFLPSPDPFTILVTNNVSFFLSLFDPSIKTVISTTSNYVGVCNSNRTVISVFEGCNGINVMIVFLSFLLAFRGSLKLTLKFLTVGLVSIYLMNLIRVGLLYFVEIHFQQYLYFFHKFFFTGVIYAAVFGLWYYWVILVKRESLE